MSSSVTIRTMTEFTNVPALIWHPCDSNLMKFPILGFIFFWFLAGSWLIPAVAVNPAPFSPGQFRRRCVQLSDSSSHPRPFLPCLPASQLALRPGPRRRSSAHYPRWRATPPRLGNGQNAYWPTLLSQVRLCMILNFDTADYLKYFTLIIVKMPLWISLIFPILNKMHKNAELWQVLEEVFISIPVTAPLQKKKTNPPKAFKVKWK